MTDSEEHEEPPEEPMEKVPLLPGPGARLRDDGSWLEPQEKGGYLYRQRSSASKGPTPAELRRRMRGDLAEAMHVAAAILADQGEKEPEPSKKWVRKPPGAREKLAALEFLAKYGIGQRKETFSPELIKALALAVQAEVNDERMLARIEMRWAEVLKQHLTGEISD